MKGRKPILLLTKALNYRNCTYLLLDERMVNMRLLSILFPAIMLCFLCGNTFAYLNATYLNTTVVLSNSTDARVVETLTINMSNSSVGQYLQDRQAINLTISQWSSVLHTNLLIQHIFNPSSSISGFTLLPGPLLYSNGKSAQASLTISYLAHNISTVSNIGPRKFEYTLNGTVLNFEHSASGVSLPPNSRFNIIIPKESVLVSVYPAPDFPPPNFLGTYNNVTLYSWYESEPLSKFTFSYLVTESLQGEVVTYFQSIYFSYTQQLYLLIIILVSVMAVYIYVKVFF
jgi:hypothetical protein